MGQIDLPGKEPWPVRFLRKISVKTILHPPRFGRTTNALNYLRLNPKANFITLNAPTRDQLRRLNPDIAGQIHTAKSLMGKNKSNVGVIIDDPIEELSGDQTK